MLSTLSLLSLFPIFIRVRSDKMLIDQNKFAFQLQEIKLDLRITIHSTEVCVIVLIGTYYVGSETGT
jgi:hypothetical protein